MIVVDSSVWIAKLRGHKERPVVRYLDRLETPDAIIVGDVVLLEVLRGARDDRHAAFIESRLREFEFASMLDPQLATLAARHYRVLRNAGITISKVPDLLIATYCIANSHLLLHDDKDFRPFADRLGLRVVDVESSGGQATR